MEAIDHITASLFNESSDPNQSALTRSTLQGLRTLQQSLYDTYIAPLEHPHDRDLKQSLVRFLLKLKGLIQEQQGIHTEDLYLN